MPERWYKEAVVYCLDVETFQDSNGDGIGHLRGLTSRLDYLEHLGVTCLWLNPIHPSPNRDDGYDVADFYNVDPRIGTLGDFVQFMHEADNRPARAPRATGTAGSASTARAGDAGRPTVPRW